MTLVWSPGYAPVDEYYDNVSLLLYGNGANNGTTITDNSPSPKTVTASNGAVTSTGQSKFGGSSLLLPNVGIGTFATRGKFVVSHSVDFELGSGDFTIEMWYYPQAQQDYSAIISRDGQDGPWIIYHGTVLSSGNPYFSGIGASLSFGSIANYQWHHLAVTRASTVFRTFTNGVLVATGASSASATSSTDNLVIGSNGGVTSGSARGIQAHIDDLRITKGVARYTSNFTPPTAPFPDI